MALSVVTFNIGGEGTRHERKKMIDKFLSKHQPSLLYFQENPWRKDYIKDHVSMIKEKYKAVSHKHGDAAVFYRKDVLEDKGSEELIKLFLDAFKGKQHLNFAKFKERASFSKLTEIKTETSFIAISWHGEHKIKDPQKKDKFKDLLLVIKELKSKTKLSVILGGDFNIALDIVSEIIKEQGFKVYNYKLPEKRKTLIDYFVVTSDVELSKVSAIMDYMYIKGSVPQPQHKTYEDVTSANESEDSEEQLKQVFDHYPVQVLVKFDIAKDSLYNVASENNEMDSLAHHFKSVKLNN